MVISTASWSRGRDWPASGDWQMSPRLSSRCRCCQRRLKVRSRSSAAQTTLSSPRCWRSWTTPTQARTVLANAALVFTDPDVPEEVLALAGCELPPPSGPEPVETPKPAGTGDKDSQHSSDVAAGAAPRTTAIPGGPDIRPALGDP